MPPTPTQPSQDIHAATRAYERWLAGHLRVVRPDLALKHDRMRENPLAFLRATYYRWAQHWPLACPELTNAPVVLAVGDLHAENFGTWRDGEGRLVWGVNDLDEAAPLPYTHDLVRLAASAELAERLSVPRDQACRQILAGYHDALEAGGEPFVLEERHGWLRALVLAALPEAARFWEKLAALSAVPAPRQPLEARRLLREALPAPDLRCRILRRVAGLGSLGRPRLVALADWNGGKLAREAKALTPPASDWAAGQPDPERQYGAELLARAVRAPDPTLRLGGGWVLRRLAPDAVRLDLSALPGDAPVDKLLYAMGWETANLHLGSPAALGALRRDLGRRPEGWLAGAAHAMARRVEADWTAWRAQHN